ncbi:DUF4398 domain-containing protein [Caldimonas brevitalea]|uniref:DUF4398 domain-containing protein n=1 Tax=Caldimonas brevitalea TaxID=413882 RepID=A0A0G3BME6_9BURK|nr:DUF4398 domain-containing protein [Caldimonas brevitalea]AKJ30582.1 hypothetical protein AAW51_3891 [Caldimonas brevitalea]
MKPYSPVPWRLAVPLLAAFAFAGCAHRTPEPSEQMAVSQAAVDGAVSAGAQQYAPLELNQARQKLDAAKNAMRTDDKLNARRLAEQAEVDAQVASAKAAAEKSRKAVGEIEQGNRMLREELARPQGRPAS